MKKCLRQKCGKEFEPTKPKQKFCSAKCRTYDYRENKPSTPLETPIKHIPPSKREIVEQVVKDLSKPNTEVKPVEQPQTNHVIDTQKISELEKELAAIPDTTKGVGKTLGDSLKRRIYALKYPTNK